MVVENVLQTIATAAGSLRAYALRSILATMGITISVAAVIAVVSIMQGFSASVSESFGEMGADTLSVRSNTTLDDQLAGRRNNISLAVFRELEQRVGQDVVLSPSFSPFGPFGTTVAYRGQEAPTRVFGVTAAYQDTTGTYPLSGRFLTDEDDRKRRRVVVVGADLLEALGLTTSPIGQFITIDGEWFRIVGVMESKGKLLGFSQDDYAMMPFSIGEAMSSEATEIDVEILVRSRVGQGAEALKPRIMAAMTTATSTGHQRGEAGDDEDVFKIESSGQMLEAFDTITTGATLILAGLVGISLLVGGIGIMNIMMVSVKERTREIGILKALGAQRGDILMQFLVEAALITTVGGLIGVAIGWGLGVLASTIIPGMPAAVVPVWAVLLAVGFSTLTGIVFGVAPAAQAANLNPVDALRYE